MLELIDISVGNILIGLSMVIRRGEYVLITGENGAGKTTLFNTISGIIKPDSGRLMLNDRDITNLPPYKRAVWISSVLQDPRVGTIGEMTIAENLYLASMRRKSPGQNKCMKKSIAFFKEKLKVLEMNLENRLDEKVRNLSGGQRQALSLVMATIADYELLLLDEITASLDPKNSKTIMNLVDKIVRDKGKTCLVITHDTDCIEAFRGSRLILSNGKVAKSTNMNS
ncbi:MAG: ATP-binding cassette domain-containing protein [Holosporales bacterium]|jgi:putative ABC transport system ATP-binding protein|nr:ATP-binding cassette domain-containing protein [Holosporales bacterium]